MKMELTPKQRDELLATLKARFGKNLGRHQGLVRARVQARLEAKPDKLWSLVEMERTGGEPDVVGVKSGEFVFMDCAPESPAGRRSVCYDRAGLESRKEHRPKNTAMDLAAVMGIALLMEEEYLALQKLGKFDLKTSSWIATPADKGRVFHTTPGHDTEAFEGVGFITTFLRGTDWAATGKVTQRIPADFPSADKPSARPFKPASAK